MDIDDLAKPRQHDVRRARKIAAMETESITKAVNDPTHHEFRRRVRRLYRRHDPRALAPCESLHGCTEFGSMQGDWNNPRAMTTQQVRKPTRHPVEWSGGFELDSEYKIIVYADCARNSDLDRDDVICDPKIGATAGYRRIIRMPGVPTLATRRLVVEGEECGELRRFPLG